MDVGLRGVSGLLVAGHVEMGHSLVLDPVPTHLLSTEVSTATVKTMKSGNASSVTVQSTVNGWSLVIGRTAARAVMKVLAGD